jgi:hydroxymethylpyrimidine pyrophosphatase-like HAD family hydrolase
MGGLNPMDLPASAMHESSENPPPQRFMAGKCRSLGVGPRRAWLLITDVDDTLLGDDAALLVLALALRRESRGGIVLNSSRPLPSIRRTLATLPVDGAIEPDAIVGGLGTEVEIGGLIDASWPERFAGFDRGPVDAVMARLGFPPHEAAYQTRLKASFTVLQGPQLDDATGALRALDAPLRWIHSGGRNLDVIPATAGKHAPVSHLAERLGVPLEAILTAGDSLNDLDLLEATRRCIVVGNADPSVRRALANHPGTHFAVGDRAAGILEGLVAVGCLEGPRARDRSR